MQLVFPRSFLVFPFNLYVISLTPCTLDRKKERRGATELAVQLIFPRSIEPEPSSPLAFLSPYSLDRKRGAVRYGSACCAFGVFNKPPDYILSTCTESLLRCAPSTGSRSGAVRQSLPFQGVPSPNVSYYLPFLLSSLSVYECTAVSTSIGESAGFLLDLVSANDPYGSSLSTCTRLSYVLFRCRSCLRCCVYAWTCRTPGPTSTIWR